MSAFDFAERINRLSTVLRPGVKIEGNGFFTGYKIGSWSTPSRLIVFLLMSLLAAAKGVVSVLGRYLVEGTPPKWLEFLVSLRLDEFVDAALPFLLITMLLYLAFSWWRHARVVRAIEDLNYACTSKLNTSYDVSMKDACDVFCDEAARVLFYEMPFRSPGCAVRYRSESGFETIARGGGLSRQRQDFSMPLNKEGPMMRLLNDPANEDIVAFVCDDTRAARDDGGLDRDNTGRDSEFSKEDRSMAVSRLFVKDGNSTEIVGIFYATAHGKRAFTADKVDIYLFLREYLNFMLLTILDREKSREEFSKAMKG